MTSTAKLFPFSGGIEIPAPYGGRVPVSVHDIPLPPRLFVPLGAHVGLAAQPVVERGQHVQKHEVIAQADGYVSATSHAPTSGRIADFIDVPMIHPGGMTAACLVIESDGEDSVAEATAAERDLPVDYEEIYRRIEAAGIVGMGGAGFPAHVKIREGLTQLVTTLIVNGVESEPFTFSDALLIQKHADEVVAGAEIVARLVAATRTVIAIQHGNPAVEQAVTGALTGSVELAVVPRKYPAGSEKQLIKVLTDHEVPSHGLPIHAGVICLNVATIRAIYRAVVYREPSIERYVTVNCGEPRVVSALVGTPLSHIMAHCGYVDDGASILTSGGSMMGVRVTDGRAPVVKTTAEIAARAAAEFLPEAALAHERTCIRCGDCIEVCPVGLQPQRLHEMARAADLDGVQDWHLFDCIECGCCSYVCPSRIPLVHYFRYAKDAVDALVEEQSARATALQRFERHQQRRSGDGLQTASLSLAPTDELTADVINSRLEEVIARNETKRRAKQHRRD